jgi:hypothetical protein
LTSGAAFNTFVAKYGSDGQLVWAKSFHATSESQGNGIVIDDDGNVAVTGAFRGQIDLDPGLGVHLLNSAGAHDVFIVKLDGAGEFLWGQRIGAGGIDVGSALAFDTDGAVNIAGHFEQTVDFDPGSGVFTRTASPVWHDAFLVKLDAAGNFVRAASFGGSGIDNANAISTDGAGNLAITGEFGAITSGSLDADPGPGTSLLNSSGGGDAYLVKLDADWNLLWAGQVGGAGDDATRSVALSADGTTYVTGQFRGTADFSFGSVVEQRSATGGSGDAYVVKVNAGGDLDWVQVFHGDTNTSGNAVIVDAVGDIYTAGAFIGTVDIDPGPDTLSLSSSGFVDGYLAKLDSNGALIWALVSPSGTGEDSVNGLALDAAGNIFAGAHFQNTATIGSGDVVVTLTSNGGHDGAVFKLAQTQPNTAPVADDLAASVTEDGQVTITLAATDVETPAADLLFTITSLPTEGQLSTTGGVLVDVGDTFVGAPTLVYEPGAAREGIGSDGFSYSVTDAGPGDALSDDAAVSIDITKAVADGEVTIDGSGVVRIGGTSGNNHILVSRTLFGSKLQVRIDGDLVSGDLPLSEVQEIRAWGREGNDKITVLLVNVPAMLHGGEGNDQIIGGLGSNLIFGGLGTDKLVGGIRDDLLVGGDANDTLLDAFGDDVLVGGNVSNQLTDDFFRDVLEQWNNDHSPNDRFAAALSDDGAADSMFDSLGDDWFTVGLDDSAVDFNPFDDDLITVM